MPAAQRSDRPALTPCPPHIIIRHHLSTRLIMCQLLFHLSLLAVVLLLASPSASALSLPDPFDITPQQIHIALGYTPTTIFVNWVTFATPTSAVLQYGTEPAALNLTLKSSWHLFTDGGEAHVNRTMHTVTLSDLTLGQRYYYAISCSNARTTSSSAVFSFTTVSPTAGTGAAEPIRVALLGDWGLSNGEATHASLHRLADAGGLDLVVHVGDFAYNMDVSNGSVGDQFMQREQPLLTRVPYQVAVGNHEAAYNFSHYINRFRMPNEESGSPTPLYSSFNVGPVHFISFDAERYFFTEFYTMEHLRMQYEWLEQDLQRAQQHRHEQPWIVAYAHRPMYCTHIANDWQAPYCTEDAAAVRDGVAFEGGLRQYGLERLFYNYSVDLYERTYPVYRERTMDTGYSGNKGTFHLITGAGGCQEYLDDFDEASVYPWSASRSDTYGYGVLSVYNATHMHWAQILDEDESVLDQVWVSKPEIKQPAAAAGVAAAAA